MTSATHEILDRIRTYECPNTTYIDPDGSWPIVWKRATGSWVWDVEGRRYLDLTAGFGVAMAGHAHPRIVQAGQKQMTQLLHAMGDVHPHALKADLARELSRITFERWNRSPPRGRKSRSVSHGRSLFCNSGFEAVEAALKTALLASGKPGIIAFTGAYHGLGYGTLNATHRPFFRTPFLDQLGGFGHFLPFPQKDAELASLHDQIERTVRRKPIGAILVEPFQGRGGFRFPPTGFLQMLRRLADASGALLVLDEILTGFGRTGAWFACEHSQVIPDLICLGKGLCGGFPLSVCVGRDEVMKSAWPRSKGEAMHTSTFLGHPVGCAMALANIQTIQKLGLVERSASLGTVLLQGLRSLKAPPKFLLQARGMGLMAGLEVVERNAKPATQPALLLVKNLLKAGYILLPEGENANVLAFTPPLTISKSQLLRTLRSLQRELETLEIRAP